MTKTKCPACGLVVPPIQAQEAPHAFHCPHCDAHVVLRQRHVHLVWDKHATPAREQEDDAVDD